MTVPLADLQPVPTSQMLYRGSSLRGALTALTFAVGLVAGVSVSGCASGGTDSTTTSTGFSSTPNVDSGSTLSSSGGSGSSGTNPGTGSDDSSQPSASDDATVPGDDGSSPEGDDSGSGTDTGTGFMLPPFTLPDSGPASSDDGGPSSCTSKICVDPVFDCPLQGCFNGCVNLHCM